MKLQASVFKYYYACLVVFLLILLASGCQKNVYEAEQYSAGDLISANSLKIYSTTEIAGIMTSYQLPDYFGASHSVEAITITYQTSDAQGNSIRASGALIIPQGIDNLPLLSIQHGTETKSDLVASVNPLNSVEGIIGLFTASKGFVTCIPDYPGFGISNMVHPYTHAKSLSVSVVDFLRATQTYCANQNITLNSELFLTGYSEGGFVTLATQREIEQNFPSEFNLIGVAPMAGTYDLKGTSDLLLQQSEYNYPTYIAFLIYAYDKLYGWDKLSEIFVSPYYTVIPTLFDGTKTFGEINSQLPIKIDSLVKQEFITNYFAGNEQYFNSALLENSLLYWTPSAPIRFFHGDADDVSPYQNMVTAVNSLRANGATDISYSTIHGGTHNTASLPSLMGAISWIDSLHNAFQINENYSSIL